MAYGYKYYREGQAGYDPKMLKVCPHCGGKSFSSAVLNKNSGDKAQCPHCGKEF
jgi:transcription elongation factor Elf1